MDHRTFVSALVFLGKRGCWWIDLPPFFGKYKSIHARFTNWSRRGVVLAFFNAVRDAKDLSLLRFVDASFVKCSIACLTGRGAGPQEVTGKTKGGFTTKVTAICDTKQRVSKGRNLAHVAESIRCLSVIEVDLQAIYITIVNWQSLS